MTEVADPELVCGTQLNVVHDPTARMTINVRAWGIHTDNDCGGDIVPEQPTLQTAICQGCRMRFTTTLALRVIQI